MIRCALCGFEYEPAPSCPTACPLRGNCHFVCCPRCGYQNIDASQSEAVKFASDVGNVISNLSSFGVNSVRNLRREILRGRSK